MLLFGFKFHLFYQVLILWGGTFSEDRDLTTNSLVLTATISELHESKTCKSDSENDATTENKHVLRNDENARHDLKETNFEEGNSEVSDQKHFPPQVDLKDVNETSTEQQEAIKVPAGMVFFFVAVSFLCMLPFLYKLVIFLWRKCKICIAKLNDTPQDNRSQNTIEMDTISNSRDQFIRNIPQPRFNSSSGKDVSQASDFSNNQSENPQEMDNTSNSSDQFTSNIPKSVLDKSLLKEDTPIPSRFSKSYTYI